MPASDSEEIFTTWMSELDEGNVAVVYMCGELDASTAPSFLSEVQSLAGAGRSVIMDVHLLSYIDSTGVGALLAIKKALERAGKRMALAGCHGLLARILEITHTQAEFPCCSDLDAALRHVKSDSE